MRALTRAEARAFDEFAMRTLRIPGIVLMENAAIGCVQALRQLASERWPRVRVEIVCGGGNNGGDGYAIARHLLMVGASPGIRAFSAPRAGSDAAVNEAIARAMGIPIVPCLAPPAAAPGTAVANAESTAAPGASAAPRGAFAPFEGDLLVDALFGTGLDREVDAAAASIIDSMNLFHGPVLAVDLPSGLDCDRGVPLGRAVRATVTATMVAPKVGFSAPGADRFTGRVVVVPIGAPLDARLVGLRSAAG